MNTPPDAVPSEVAEREAVAMAAAKRGLRLVSATLPHLSGLVHAVRLKVTDACTVACVGASGLVCVNPEVFSSISMLEARFVMAHELLHLALDTFSRGQKLGQDLSDAATRTNGTPNQAVDHEYSNSQSNLERVNIAHDYLINDQLRDELGQQIPLGGLDWDGARSMSMEYILGQMQQYSSLDQACWSSPEEGSAPGGSSRSKGTPPKTIMQIEMEKAGLAPKEPEPEQQPQTAPPRSRPRGDVLTREQEAELEPELSPDARRVRTERVRTAAVKSAELGELRQSLEKNLGSDGSGDANDSIGEEYMQAVETAYRPPWELALQHWLDAVAPAGRSFGRASRRGGDRLDIVLPGRKREGWTLHIVLDTSGSMETTLPHILGLIASFCENAGVAQIHILQCDVGVTADDWIDPTELSRFKVAGFGGSDMSPAMNQLAADPEVAAVLILTDGYIDFPSQEPEYRVLWGLVDGDSSFNPAYGAVVHVRT